MEIISTLLPPWRWMEVGRTTFGNFDFLIFIFFGNLFRIKNYRIQKEERILPLRIRIVNWNEENPFLEDFLAKLRPPSFPLTNRAVLSDLNTCTYTPASTEQRYWQLQVQQTVIESVAVSITPSSHQQFTIFVIELVGSKALYKPCATFKVRVV